MGFRVRIEKHMTNDMQAGMMYALYIVMLIIFVFYSGTLLGGLYHHGFEGFINQGTAGVSACRACSCWSVGFTWRVRHHILW